MTDQNWCKDYSKSLFVDKTISNISKGLRLTTSDLILTCVIP